jgi:hypothetical protein
VSPADEDLHGVLAARGQQVLAVQLRLDVAPAQQRGDLLLDEFGLAFLHHQHGALAGAEVGDLFRHQGIGDVQHQQGISVAPNASARPSCCRLRTSAL